MSRVADIAIVGGGPAGSIAALVLARAGRRTILIDRAATASQPFKIGESLPGAARPLLRDLGLLELVEGSCPGLCHGNRSSWGSSGIDTTDFIRDPHGPGWHLDRARFDESLRKEAERAGAKRVLDRVTGAAALRDGILLRLEGSTVEAGSVIDASGRAAVVARRLGALRSRDDGLVALHAWYRSTGGDLDSRTLIEASPRGWWYTAGLPGQARVVSLHLDATDARAIVRDPGLWQNLLSKTTHLREALRGARALTPLRCVQACGGRLDRFHGAFPASGHWVAAGDAALSFDPLSSQGIFNSLFSGLRAAQALERSMHDDGWALQSYSERLEEIRRVYLARHRLYYASEARWAREPFWQKRMAGSI